VPEEADVATGAGGGLMPRLPMSLIDPPAMEHPISPGAIIRDAVAMRHKPGPITVEAVGGRYRLVRGKRRFMVARTEGHADIEAEIREPRHGK
jgi:hypothetical protein